MKAKGLALCPKRLVLASRRPLEQFRVFLSGVGLLQGSVRLGKEGVGLIGRFARYEGEGEVGIEEKKRKER